MAIARCLERRPKLLLADEPTAALDDESKSVVARLLRETAASRGIGVVIASHDYGLLSRVADRVLHLSCRRLQPFAYESQTWPKHNGPDHERQPS